MNKQQLELKLQEAFDNGFWPKDITKYRNGSPLRVVPKEEDRICVMYRTTEMEGRQHNHQFIYSLEEVTNLLKEAE